MFIINQTKGKTQRQIENNQLLVDSIMLRIIQISENNMNLSEAFRQKHKDIPWQAIKGMRNKITHDYGTVKMTIVYDTVKKGVPSMYKALCKIKV